MSANASVLEDLQSQLEVAHIPFENLSTLVQTGDEKVIIKFWTSMITETVYVRPTSPFLYMLLMSESHV